MSSDWKYIGNDLQPMIGQDRGHWGVQGGVIDHNISNPWSPRLLNHLHLHNPFRCKSAHRPFVLWCSCRLPFETHFSLVWELWSPMWTSLISLSLLMWVWEPDRVVAILPIVKSSCVQCEHNSNWMLPRIVTQCENNMIRWLWKTCSVNSLLCVATLLLDPL